MRRHGLDVQAAAITLDEVHLAVPADLILSDDHVLAASDPVDSITAFQACQFSWRVCPHLACVSWADRS